MSLYFNGGSISAGSGGGSDDTYTKAEINGLLSAKSNTGLDNLNADGQMIIDSQNGTISNCILEIPQNLKVELSGTTFTLKSGSTITLTGSTYTTLTTTVDKNIDLSSLTDDGLYYVIPYSIGEIVTPRLDKYVTSGTTPPTTDIWANFSIFFNTNEKIFYRYNGSIWEAQTYGYPLCRLKRENGVWSIDQVFNGFGFIGSSCYYFPSIKLLFADGINTDGTLKSIEYTTDRVMISSGAYACPYLVLYGGNTLGPAYYTNYSEQEEQPSFTNGDWYQPSTNTIFHIDSGVATKTTLIHVFDQTVSSGKITSMTIRHPYEGARDLLTDNKQNVLTSITGYDSTQTQTLKNINGVLQWVTD